LQFLVRFPAHVLEGWRPPYPLLLLVEQLLLLLKHLYRLLLRQPRHNSHHVKRLLSGRSLSLRHVGPVKCSLGRRCLRLCRHIGSHHVWKHQGRIHDAAASAAGELKDGGLVELVGPGHHHAAGQGRGERGRRRRNGVGGRTQDVADLGTKRVFVGFRRFSGATASVGDQRRLKLLHQAARQRCRQLCGASSCRQTAEPVEHRRQRFFIDCLNATAAAASSSSR